ncbi:hypothetical protein N7541_002064 [Penicillium brevicompactum]|uniref:Uncharacterized protein n=1 Tax=Penicillium brevicompactum TaxID=5074 RepID=A0A9W9RJ81_PENBR|nr:hypothetical protein N7541_002064 [Penicillium brevicompactum]
MSKVSLTSPSPDRQCSQNCSRPPEIRKLIAQIEKIGALARKSEHIGDQWTSSLCAPFLNGFLIEMWTTQLAILSTAICNIGDAIEAVPPGPGRTFLRRYLHNAAGHYYQPPTEENQNDLSQSAKAKPTPAQASKTSNSIQRPTRGSLVYRHREPRTQYRVGPYPPPRSSSFAPTRCEPNSRRREPETWVSVERAGIKRDPAAMKSERFIHDR